MQNSGLKIIAALILLLMPQMVLAAGINDPARIGIGARSIAMGKTTINRNEIGSIFVNPANSTTLDTGGITSMQASVAEDVVYTFVGVGIPTPRIHLGFGFLSSGIASIYRSIPDASGRFVPNGTMDYSNNVIMMVIGQRISTRLTLGQTIKVYSRSMGVSGGTATGVDMDFGMLYKIGETINFGLTLQNIIPMNYSALRWTNGTEEDIPTLVRGGVNVAPREDINITADLDVVPDTPSTYRAGVEKSIGKVLALRGGIEYLPAGKTSYSANLTAGVGLKFYQLCFDYAYYMDNTLSENSTHFFSISYRFPFLKIESQPIFRAQN
ncbi:MAG: hypothetical protein ABIB65_02800 [Candidatus Margulisiibacteriota bacterium]